MLPPAESPEDCFPFCSWVLLQEGSIDEELDEEANCHDEIKVSNMDPYAASRSVARKTCRMISGRQSRCLQGCHLQNGFTGGPKKPRARAHLQAF